MTPYCFGKPIRKHSICVLFSGILFLSLALSGCGDTSGKKQEDRSESFSFGRSLYVTNEDGSLLVFDPLSTDKGSAKAVFAPIVQDENISPSRRFPEAVTGPTGVFLDRFNNTLYVANTGQSSISIYDSASTLATPFSATRVISGKNTLLNHPFGVTFDRANNRIFVANTGGNSILVFEKDCNGATNLSGNIKPCRVLLGTEDPNSAGPAKFPLDVPRALVIDTTRDILYISNMGNDSILIYDNAGSLGGPPTQCVTDFTDCNQVPSRTISPHTNTDKNKQISKLELPFGLFIDSQNDRLYVVNTGLNTPGIFIYENASKPETTGGITPDRIIAGNNKPTAEPPIRNLTQLTIPTGIDVDVATGQVYVINNNSPNNVNQLTDNIDSPSLLVFNDIDTSCTTTMPIPCNIAPTRRTGGDVSATLGSTLSSPTGVAYDPAKQVIYITNTGANNLFLYAFAGDIVPQKINADTNAPGNTSIDQPGDFHYDATLDRLLLANFGSTSNGANVPILVYDKISTLSFSASQPTWSIRGFSNFIGLRGLHIDKTLGFFLTLSAAATPFSPTLSIYCIPTITGGVNVNCPASPTAAERQWFSGTGNNPIDFPSNVTDEGIPDAGNKLSGQQLRPPSPLKVFSNFSPGGINSGPTAMEVDEVTGDVYVSDKGTNTIFVYNLDSLLLTRTITGANTQLNKPHGLSYDPIRNILYVTNVGDNTVLVFDNANTINGNAAPNRIVTSTTLPLEDQLLSPIAPQINPEANSLFLISSGNNAVFAYDDASQLNGETSPSKKVVGIDASNNPLFDFIPSGGRTNQTTGALLVAQQNGSQAIFIGQPESPICTNAPANCPSGALLIFGAEGKIAPSAVWTGGAGVFTAPSGVTVDTTRNVLYVANQSTDTLSILKNADQLDIHVNPVSGKTDLDNIQLNAPTGLFIDILKNRLYISNSGDNKILAFDNPDTLVNGTTPDLSITVPQLNSPRGITVDTSRNRLYVANAGGNSVLTFMVAGTASVDFVLSGTSTQLSSPISVAIDTERDDLYVLNNNAASILIFEKISSRNGNVSPSRIISGSDAGGKNFMTTPSAIFIDSEKDLLYVTDRGSHAVYFFPNASRAQGQAEHGTLSGDNTGLNKPSALFVDTRAGNP